MSSTFADMAAERDAMVRAALPLLRAMAAPHAVGLSEVDLRWGVDHPDPRRSVGPGQGGGGNGVGVGVGVGG